MTEFKPILASLGRHKLIASLLALLVALTCAIVCNVAFMIQRQEALMSLPSGVAEDQLVLVQSASLDRTANQLARHETDLAALRMIPGVESAVAVDALPFNGNNWTSSVQTSPDAQAYALASLFTGTRGELGTLGLKLVAGRDFREDEYMPLDAGRGNDGIRHVPAAIITRALAERLFPGQNPLGKSIYPYDNPIRIVGVVEHLLRPDVDEGADNGQSILFPLLPDSNSVTYVLRTSPGERARVMQEAADTLYHLAPDRVLRDPQTFAQMRDDYFQRQREMIGLLIASVIGLMFVTALGITGLANFWVLQRTRTIGIRRAVGATRTDILRYFQTENFLIVTLGIALGVLLAVALNLVLTAHYQLPRLPLWYLPVGALALWLLGQFAILAPALRASRVPPVVATRSV